MMTASRTARARSGFTLIELLTVIVVLAMLGSISLAALHRARRNVQKQRVKAEQDQLESAVRKYYSVYGMWPCPLAGQTGTYDIVEYSGETGANGSNAVVVSYLRVQGAGGGVNYLNPRQELFLQVDTYRVVNGQVCDPWGRPYRIRMDLRYPGPSCEIATGVKVVALDPPWELDG